MALTEVGMMRYQVGRSLQEIGRFIRLTARDLKSPTTRMLRRKLRTLVAYHIPRMTVSAALFPFSLVAVVVIRLLRPVVVVRISALNASRIGHLSFDPEMSAAEKELGVWLPRQPVFDVWYAWRGSYPIANHQMLAMWRRSLRVWPTWLWQRIDSVSRLVPGGAAHVVPIRKNYRGLPDHQQGDPFRALQRTRPHVSFTDDEAREARRQLEVAGCDPSARHVCVLVRDPSYQRSVVPGDHSAHDFRDSNISKFVPAMQWIADQGVIVYRMGAVVRQPLTPTVPSIVDYASRGMRSELLDVWLAATCEFFVSTATGLDGVANAFRRTRVFADLSQLNSLNLSFDTLSIPKLLFTESDGRLLTLRESVHAGALTFVDTTQLTSRGLGLRGNSPEEIVSVVREAHERRTGTWETRPDEDDLHQRMLAALPESMKMGRVIGRVGYEFLRANQWWLD